MLLNVSHICDVFCYKKHIEITAKIDKNIDKTLIAWK